MLIIPAIDIKDGKVVRLRRGEFDKVSVYSDDPVLVAREWEQQGAKLLHIVDLDGAISGQLKNLSLISDIAKAVSVPVEAGGGVRTQGDIERLLSCGAHRVILGTRACEDEAFVKQMLAIFAERLLVSMDVKNGFVATDGWKGASKITPKELIKRMELFGLRILIYTDISRDGMLSGPDIEGLKELLKARESVLLIASGGISSLDDLLMLKGLEADGLFGVIVGKALYEKRINLKEAIEKC